MCQHEINLLLVPFAFCFGPEPSDKYPEPEHIQGVERVQKMMVNHIFFFFYHFESKHITYFQLDQNKSQMTLNFRKSLPSLHIESVEKSVEYSHQQRCTICDSFSNALAYSHTRTVLPHVDQCLNIKLWISTQYHLFQRFGMFQQKWKKKKLENYVFRATIDIELLNILLFIFFSWIRFFASFGSFYHSIIPYGIAVDKQLVTLHILHTKCMSTAR